MGNMNTLKYLGISALTSSCASVANVTSAVVGGALKTVGDTAQSVYKSVNVVNKSIHVTTERLSYSLDVYDKIKRNKIYTDVNDSLVVFGEAEDHLFERTEKLTEDTVEGLKIKLDEFKAIPQFA